MASTPSRPERDSPAALREADVRRPKDEVDGRSHLEQVKASLAWALDEYSATLANLAK